MPVRNIQILCLALFVSVACCIQAQRLKYAGKIGTAIMLIEDRYVDQVDPQDLYLAAMEGIVSKLDQNSAFIPPKKYEEFQQVIEQEFGGIGVLIEGPPAAKRLTVVAPIPGTPAFEAKMQPGDVILEIDGQSTEGLESQDATEKMRGPVGQAVNLKIQRLGIETPLEVEIHRADIQVDSVYGDRIRGDSSWDFRLEEDPRIAYIRVTLFGERTVGEFNAALEKVKDAQAIILDLRYNPGGILPSAVTMCDMFLSEGVIVSTRGRYEGSATERTADPQLMVPANIPIVVMVNDQSASASEIMAACLQDNHRAKVAGQRSFGKGTVQQVFDLENDTALKFTTARFYRPNGKNIHRLDEMKEEDEWGVTPDGELGLTLTPLQELYLQKRWNMRGDPRIMAASSRPPSPACAGDPQLRLVLEHLQNAMAQLRSE